MEKRLILHLEFPSVLRGNGARTARTRMGDCRCRSSPNVESLEVSNRNLMHKSQSSREETRDMSYEIRTSHPTMTLLISYLLSHISILFSTISKLPSHRTICLAFFDTFTLIKLFLATHNCNRHLDET